jgi:uncharacterized protein YrzB (UPF0473 family)
VDGTGRIFKQGADRGGVSTDAVMFSAANTQVVVIKESEGGFMNERNTELFFGDEDNNVVITLTDEDGRDTDVMLVASFEIEEMASEYLIAVETDENGEMTEEMELLKYLEDEDGEPEIATIDDEEEYALVAEVCKDLLRSGAIEGFSVDEEDEDDGDGGYLSDLGDIFPGLSIDQD